MSSFWHHVRTQWLSISLVLGVVWILAVRVYYWIKPSLPEAVRLKMRRWWAHRTRERCNGEWPILESAGVAPAGWKGWPEARQKFALVLTHDVEGERGLQRVKQLAELEMSMGFRSAFNFIPEGPYRVPKDLRDWLVERGFEVGVHDHRHDGHLYRSRAHFMASAKRINLYLKEWNAVGFRSGFMFHNLKWIHDLDISYDASTFDTDPFEPQHDRAGTIFPFWVNGNNGDGYMELPYTLVQDSTLFVMLGEKSCDVWKRKVDWIASRGGMVLLNVHPDYVALDGEEPEIGEFPVEYYKDFLDWVNQTYREQYWQSLPREVADFCRKRFHGVLAGIAAFNSADLLIAI